MVKLVVVICDACPLIVQVCWEEGVSIPCSGKLETDGLFENSLDSDFG